MVVWVKLRSALSQGVKCALHTIAQRCLCAAPAGSAGEITSKKYRKDFLDCAVRLLGDVQVFLWDVTVAATVSE